MSEFSLGLFQISQSHFKCLSQAVEAEAVIKTIHHAVNKVTATGLEPTTIWPNG